MKPVSTYHSASEIIRSKSNIPTPIILKQIPHDTYFIYKR